MLKTKKLKFALLAVLLFCVFFSFRPQLAKLFRTDFANEGYYYSRQFGHPMKWVNTDNLTQIGAALTEDECSISYKFPKKPDDRVILKILFGQPQQGIETKYKNINYVLVQDEDTLIKKLDYANLPIGAKAIDLSRLLSGHKVFNIQMASLSAQENRYGQQLAIRRLEISVLPPQRKFLPNLSLIIAWIIMPLILFECFGKARKIGSAETGRFLFLILLIIAIHLRWQEVERLTFAPAHPDAGHPSGISYRDSAEKMRLFSKTDGFYAARDWHEPFYPFMAKIFFTIFGSSDLHLRFVSFSFSVLAVALTYLVGKRIFQSEFIALLSCGLITINNFLIEQSAFGIRMELETCLLLLLFYFCYLGRDELKGWQWVLISGIIGGYFLLTKSYSLPVILFIFLYSMLTQKRWPAKKRIGFFILAAILALIIYLPYRINSRQHQIVSLSGSDKYATEFANNEFRGSWGFPRDKVSLGEYYFKLHTPAQFIGYHLVGIGGVFYFLSEQIFNVIQEQNHLLKIIFQERLKGLFKYPLLTLKIALFSLIGLFSILICFKGKNFRVIIYMIIIGNLQNLFLYGASFVKRYAIIETQRTIAHVLPFVAFCIAYTLYHIYTNQITALILRLKRKSSNNANG